MRIAPLITLEVVVRQKCFMDAPFRSSLTAAFPPPEAMLVAMPLPPADNARHGQTPLFTLGIELYGSQGTGPRLFHGVKTCFESLHFGSGLIRLHPRKRPPPRRVSQSVSGGRDSAGLPGQAWAPVGAGS